MTSPIENWNTQASGKPVAMAFDGWGYTPILFDVPVTDQDESGPKRAGPAVAQSRDVEEDLV